MSQDPTLFQQEALSATRRSTATGFNARERFAAQVLGAGFVLACAGLWVAQPPHHLHLAPGLWSLLVMVVAL